MSFAWTELAKFLDLRKIPAELWLAVALATGAILLVPETTAALLGLDALRDSHRPFFGGAFVLADAVLISKGLAFVGVLIKETVRRWRDRQQLHYLAPDQWEILARYLREDTCTLKLGIDDGVALGLEQLGLIRRTAQVGTMHRGFAYNIMPWLRSYLLKHPEVLEHHAPQGHPAETGLRRT